jgi:DNA polymerase III subunit alpha
LSKWCQLHTHTHYSLLDGIIKRKDLIDKCKELEFAAVAVTEHGNVLNAAQFIVEAREAGIKPIQGMEAYVSPIPLTSEEKSKTNDHLLLLAKNTTGLKNIFRLSSLSFSEGFYGGRGRIDYPMLFAHKEGIIVSTACLAGRVNRLLADDNFDDARAWLELMVGKFGEDFYVELIDGGWKMQAWINAKLIPLAQSMGIPMIATNDVHYITRDDAYLQDVALAVQIDSLISNKARPMSIYEDGIPITDGYLKTLDEMKLLGFPEESYINVGEIVDKIEDYDVKYAENPTLPTYGSIISSRLLLEKICQNNWHKLRLHSLDEEDYYSDRYHMEMDVIDKLGFIDYHLIIWDIIDYCKTRGILTGPGRGSASGSLVVYLLGITELDPIRYGLFFERYLNPERIAPPDIDFDVEQGYRQEVMAYIKHKYGSDNVIQIGTIGRMGIKDTIKRIGKSLDIDFKTTAKLTSEIHVDDGTRTQDMNDVEEQHPGVMEKMKVLNPDWWDYSVKLCNLPINLGVHAAGVVISNEGLRDVPLAVAGKKKEGKELVQITQYDMHVLEKLGYTKFDLLGLKSLDIIHATIDLIMHRHANKSPFSDIRDIYNESCIPLDDKKTYELISKANTIGVFQLVNEGFRSLCRSLQPENFEHIAALNALYRPGPMGSGVMDAFIERRHGRQEVVYEFPELEEITKKSFGLCLYQEDLMRLAVEVAGYTLPQADYLRKIIGKKLVEKIEEEGKDFIERGLKFGRYDEENLIKAYEIIKPAGRYAWNLAHAAAYGYITYIMAWLKANYMIEFYVASLNANITDSKQVSILIRDAVTNGIKVVPPNINLSEHYFSAFGDMILYGMQSINGVGAVTADAIMQERKKNGPYEGLIDFTRRMSMQFCNSKHRQLLVQSGAFEGVDIERPMSRAAMFDAMPLLCERRKGKKYKISTIEKRLKNARETKPIDSAEVFECEQALLREPDKNDRYIIYDPISYDMLVELPEWDNMTIYRNEMLTLGISLTAKLDDLFTDYRRWVEVGELVPTSDALTFAYGWRVIVAGIAERIHKITTKTNKEMAFVTVADDSGTVDLVVFPEPWGEGKLPQGEPLVAICRVDTNKNGNEKQLVADKLIPMASGIAISYVQIKEEANVARLQEFAKFNHFNVTSSMLLPSVGSNFKLTRHVGHILDLLIGIDRWKAVIS